MKLYNYWRSSSSYRVRVALHFKDLPFEYVPVSLIEGEQLGAQHLSRNPLTTVPVLEVTEGGKTLLLPQSVAIVEYLEERYPLKPLFPKGLEHRAAMRALVEQVNSGIQPFQNLSAMKFVKEELKADDKAFARHFISRGLIQLEALVKRTAGRFMVGDAFTFADACLVPQLFGARRFGVETENFVLLTKLEKASLELDFVQKSAPDRQIDAHPSP